MSMGSHFNRKWKNAFALKSASTNVPYFRGKTADSFGQSADTLGIDMCALFRQRTHVETH